MSRASQLATGTVGERLAAMSELRAASGVPGADERAALFNCLGHERKLIQRRAAETLAQLAVRDAAIRVQLETLVRDPLWRVRWGAVFALSVMDALTPVVLDTLLEALAVDDGDVRWAAASLLSRLHVADSSLVSSRLLAMAVGGSAEGRKMALYCLRDFGVSAGAGVAETALHDAEAPVRLAAISALSRLADDRVAAAARIAGLIEDADERVRRAAAATLGSLGTRSPEVITALERAQQSSDASLRRAAERSLALLGGRKT